MVGIGILVVALGLIGVLWCIFQRVKAGRVASAPLVSTGDAGRRGRQVAGPRGEISAQGGVVCSQWLISPVTGTACLYYEVRCKAEWKEGEITKTKELHHEKRAAPFLLDDGSGTVWIDARQGGDFEPTQTKRETKGTGLLGGIAGGQIMFGGYRVSTGALSLGTTYTVEEQILPVVPYLYACGRLGEHGNAIAAPGWRSLILSNKTRAELLGSAAQSAKTSLIVGAAAVAIGSSLAMAGQLLGMDVDADAHMSARAAATITQTATATPPAPVGARTTPADGAAATGAK
jgi:hypothetical protein